MKGLRGNLTSPPTPGYLLFVELTESADGAHGQIRLGRSGAEGYVKCSCKEKDNGKEGAGFLRRPNSTHSDLVTIPQPSRMNGPFISPETLF